MGHDPEQSGDRPTQDFCALGICRNFGFIGATAMVTDCHSEAERGKAQGAKDFLIFGTVAGASFFAGALLHASGWQTMNWLIFPAVALILVPLVWQSTRKGVGCSCRVS